jgi:hypothetical protein
VILRFLCALICIGGASTLAPGAAVGAPRPVVVDSLGRWTLRDLGYGELVFRRSSSQHVYFRLPAGARQGGRTWYLLHLRFSISFSNEGKPGFADVSVLHNGYACALIRFRADPKSVDRKLEWATTGMVGGDVHRVSTQLTATVRFSNFCQNSGVKGGVNDLLVRVGVRDPGGPRLDKLVVFDDSGIEISPDGPAELALVAHATDRRPKQGGRFEVRYVLGNPGKRPVENIHVGLAYDREALKVEGAPTQAFPQLSRGQRREGTFRVRAAQPGPQQIEVLARSNSDHRIRLVKVNVVQASAATGSGGGPWVAWLLAAGGLVIVAGLALLRTRRRSGRPLPSGP